MGLISRVSSRTYRNKRKMSDSESVVSDCQIGIEGFDPATSDFHMIKEFLKQSLQGLSGFNRVNLSQLANIIIEQSGKCGSVLKQVGTEQKLEDDDDDESTPKKQKNDEKQENNENDQKDGNAENEEEDDSILGLAS